MLDRIIQQIRADGPLRFSDYVDLALYDPDGGFYTGEGRAGRRGDFVTSPEVGPLFGACIANALDGWWEDLGRPDPFTFIEYGAGPGTLARAILSAQPACSAALDYRAVEVSAAQRAMHPEGVTSAAVAPSGPIDGVVFANELLDNLAFDMVERTEQGWCHVRVGERSGQLVLLVAESMRSPHSLPDAPPGTRVPVIDSAVDWLEAALDRVRRGRVVVVDYGAPTAVLAERGDWLRTYRGHDRGTDPLAGPGLHDITIDVPFDQLDEPAVARTQAQFLTEAGAINALVAEGKAIWAERAHLGDLAAIRARSRVSEAEALLDPTGLGAFMVLEWNRN